MPAQQHAHRCPIDGGVDVVVHIIIDRKPAFGPARLTPVDQPKIEPLRQQTLEALALCPGVSLLVAGEGLVRFAILLFPGFPMMAFSAWRLARMLRRVDGPLRWGQRASDQACSSSTWVTWWWARC